MIFIIFYGSGTWQITYKVEFKSKGSSPRLDLTQLDEILRILSWRYCLCLLLTFELNAAHPSSKGAVIVVVASGEAEGGADDGEDAADGARAQDRIQEMMVVIEKEGRKEGWTDLFVWELGVYGDSYLILISLIVD